MSVSVFLSLLSLILLRPYPGLVDWLGGRLSTWRNITSIEMEGQATKLQELLVQQGVPQPLLDQHLPLAVLVGEIDAARSGFNSLNNGRSKETPIPLELAKTELGMIARSLVC